MRALKVLGWIVAVFVVLLIAGFFALRVMLPPEKLRAMVLPRLEQALGQRVEVGPVHLAIWGGFGVAVEDLRIGNRPGYSDEHMLVLDELVLRIPLRPLLRRQLEIRKVALVGPRVFAEKSAGGELNIAGLGQRLSPPEAAPGQPPAEPAKPARPVALPVPITLESFTIDGGALRYTDVAAGMTADVRDIRHRASLSMDRELRDVRVEGNLSAGEVRIVIRTLSVPLPAFELQMFHRAKVDMVQSVLTLESVDVNALGAKMGVRGTVEDFENPLLHLQTNLATSLASLALKPGTELTGTLTSDVRVDGPALRPEEIQVLGTVAVDRLNLTTPELPVPLKDVTGQIILKGRDVEIPALSGNVGSSTVNVRAAIALAIPFAATGGKVVPAVDFEIRCPHLVADEFLPEPEAPGDAPAETGPEPADPGPPTIPPIPEMNVSGAVIVEKITAKKLEAMNLRITIGMAENRLSVPEWRVDVYSGRVAGTAEADFRALPDLPFAWTVEASGVEANDFLSLFTPFEDHLFGRLDLEGEFEARGLTPPEIRRSLRGKGRMSVTQGRLVNWDMARELSKWIKFLEFEDIDFRNLSLDYQVADEKVAMRPLKLKALDTSWKADGWAGFDQTIDYLVTATLSREATKRMQEKTSLTGLVTADVGQAEVVFHISGKAKSPRFSWDTESIEDRAKDRAKQEAQDFIDKKKDEIADALMKEADKRLEGDTKDAARKILGDFLKADSTDTTGSGKKLEELKKEGEKTLKELFGKKKKD